MNILFRKVGIVEPLLKLFQSNVEQAFQIIASLPFVSGHVYSVETTTSDPFDINTGLQNSPQGWVVIDTDVSVTFYRTKGPKDAAGTLTLTPSTDGNYKFWVF